MVKTMAKMRSGRLSIDDMQFIEQNCKKMSYTEIARSLDRSIPAIKKYVETKVNTKASLETKAIKLEYDIMARPYWKEIEQQFETDELPLFVYHWDKMISQFKDDVLPTEELQIVDMIKMELMMNRILKQQKSISNNILKLETMLLEEQNKDVILRDMMSITSMQTQLSTIRQAQQSFGREFQSLGDKKLDILKALKATRLDRIKKLEDSRQSFVGWLSALLQDKDLRREWGVHIEKMRIASEIEKDRLSEYHTYADGQIDQPFLTPENVKEDNVLH
jgi:hypothetical protein